MAGVALMPPTDSMFLLAESREHPMHVGGLQLFSLPEGADPDHLTKLHRELVADTDVRDLFRRRPRAPVNSLGQWSWQTDDDLDLEYHVRLSALPRPGRVRELLELTSRLHGSLLDRHRPLWEHHVIEGLDGGRFATYNKVHHALLDGVSALRVLERSLSDSPDVDGLRAPWSPLPPRPAPVAGSGPADAADAADAVHLADDGTAAPEVSGPVAAPAPPRAGRAPAGPFAALRSAIGAVADVAGLVPTLARIAQDALADTGGTLPFQAPRSILNVPITGARRFAAQSWSLARVRAVAAATGCTVNDVVLAMCAGALRAYLLDLGALPDRPLVAAVPVSLRRSAESAGGNAVGLILCSLATDVADPTARLRAIHVSMRRGKAAYSGLTPLQILALSGLAIAPLALTGVPGVVQLSPPPFNLLISNVPGPAKPLYWNGARLEGVYPVSIPYEGQALNITVTSYAGSLEFGLTGCRRSVPSLQRLLTHLEESLSALE